MECIFAAFMITCTCMKHLIVVALKFPNGFKSLQNEYIYIHVMITIEITHLKNILMITWFFLINKWMPVKLKIYSRRTKVKKWFITKVKQFYKNYIYNVIIKQV